MTAEDTFVYMPKMFLKYILGTQVVDWLLAFQTNMTCWCYSVTPLTHNANLCLVDRAGACRQAVGQVTDDVRGVINDVRRVLDDVWQVANVCQVHYRLHV